MKSRPVITRATYVAGMRNIFSLFAVRAFMELNPHAEFIPGSYIPLVAATLDKCRTGETPRLILNCPPRTLKSHMASVALPAFILGHNPSAEIIAVSYGQDLAEKHARDTRTLMASRFYQELFPDTRLLQTKQAVHDFMTTKNGSRMATSVGGVLTGRGADVIIIDDPMKPGEALSEPQRKAVNDWYSSTLLSRLNSKANGVIIIVMQRLHQADLVGEVRDRDPGGWEVLSLPAIAVQDESYAYADRLGERTFSRKAGTALHPERDSLETYQRIRDVMGEYTFQSQYQQTPTAREGGIIKREWIQSYATGAIPTDYFCVVQSWDTAFKTGDAHDFSVCTTWMITQGKAYLLDVFRKRLSYPELRQAVIEQSNRYHPDEIIIEECGSGIALLDDLKREYIYGIRPYKPAAGMSKAERLEIQSSKFKEKLVYLPEQAPWREPYIEEITGFPGTKHDDQVDSTTQALDYLSHRLQLSKPGDCPGFFDPRRCYEYS